MVNQARLNPFDEAALAEVIHRAPLAIDILTPGEYVSLLLPTRTSPLGDSLEPFVMNPNLCHDHLPFNKRLPPVGRWEPLVLTCPQPSTVPSLP
jgi:hypothetical protein